MIYAWRSMRWLSFLSIYEKWFTADNCGHYSLTRGYWDYCLYKKNSQPDYLSKSWEEKTGIIMKQVVDYGPSLGLPTELKCNRNNAYIFGFQKQSHAYVIMFKTKT